MRTRLLIALMCAFAAVSQAQTFQPILQPRETFVNGSGLACAGCSLYSYQAGTNTPQATYTDSTGSVQNQNPITLDASGSAAIWVGSSAYKFILADTFGTILWTVDNVTSPIASGAGPFLALTGGTVTGATTFSSTFNSSGTANFSATANFTHLLNGTFTGTYPTTGWFGEANFLSDGASSSAMWTASQGGSVGGMGALVGGVAIPSASASHQATGIVGFADNFNAGATNGVGGYFVGICEETGGLCWGSNTLVGSVAGHPANLFGHEIDWNANNTGDIGYGLGIIGAWTAQPTGEAQAITIRQPVGGSYHWNTGLQIETGAAPTAAIYINPAASGTGQPSQPIVLVSTGGSSNTFSEFEDSTGALVHTYQNGSTATMPEPPASGGFPIGGPLVTFGSVTIAGCSATGLTGSATAGTFNSGTTGTCTVTLTFPTTAPHGFACPRPSDISTPADTNSWQVQGFNTTQASFTGTTASGDEILFGPCVAF